MEPEEPALRRPDEVIPNRHGSTAVMSQAPGPRTFDVEEEPMQLRHFWNIVRRRFSVVVITVFAIVIPVALLTATMPDYYESRARLEVTPEKADPDLISRTSNEDPRDPTYMSTQLQLMRSPVVLRLVVVALNLEHDPVYTRSMASGGRLARRLLRMFYIGKKYDLRPSGHAPLTKSLNPSVSADKFNTSKEMDRYVADLGGRVKVELVREARSLVRETRLVDVTMRHSNPEMSAKLANALVDAYVHVSREQNTQGSREDNESLTRRVVELQSEIRDIERSLARYAQNHKIISLEPGQNIVIERLVNLNTSLVEAENARKIAEARYHSALEGAATLIDEADRRNIAELETNLENLREKRAQLLVGATEKWPAVKEITEQIETAAAHLKRVREEAAISAVAMLKTKYIESRDKEDSLRGAFDNERQANQIQNQAAVNYRLLQQEIDARKQILGVLLARVGKAAASEATAASNARVIDYAFIPDPDEPAGPARLIYVLIAGLISLFIGLILAIVYEHMDTSLRSARDVQAWLRLPSVTIMQSPSSFRGLPTAINRSRFSGHELIVNAQAPPWLSEEYRRLRASLLLNDNASGFTQVLLTSSIPGEGKTTTAVNLAVSFAREGGQVLLVDADMRRPRVHQIFQLDNGKGLSSLLGSLYSVHEVGRYILPTEVAGMSVLPAGPYTAQASDLLSSSRVKELFSLLGSSYQHVVVDAPSIGSASDALLLSRVVDRTLLVVKAGTISRDIIQDAVEQIRGVGGKLFGIVLNATEKNLRAEYYQY